MPLPKAGQSIFNGSIKRQVISFEVVTRASVLHQSSCRHAAGLQKHYQLHREIAKDKTIAGIVFFEEKKPNRAKTNRAMPFPSTPTPTPTPSLSDKIAPLLSGLFYLSESEAPVALLEWPGIQTINAAQQHAATLHCDQPEAYTLQSTADFLRPIQQMGATDPGLKDYATQWRRVLKTMEQNLREVQVIRGQVKSAVQQLYITGFTDSGALALYTSAVVT